MSSAGLCVAPVCRCWWGLRGGRALRIILGTLIKRLGMVPGLA